MSAFRPKSLHHEKTFLRSPRPPGRRARDGRVATRSRSDYLKEGLPHVGTVSMRRVCAMMAVVSALFACTDIRSQPALADADALHATLDSAEKQHRAAYNAANFPAAIVAARGGLALAEHAGTLLEQVQFLGHLAYDYWLMGDNDSALEYTQRVLDAAEQLNDHRVRSRGHRYLSIIYETLADRERSRCHAEEALRFAELADDGHLRILALNSVALNQVKAGQLNAAERGFEESRMYWENNNSRWNAANALANIADIADIRGDLTQALKLYDEIYATRVDVNDRRGQVRAVCSIASLLRRLDRPDEALARMNAARELAESVGGKRILAEFYGVLAQVHEARHDFAAALKMERVAVAEREQLATERAHSRAIEVDARLELAQKQRLIEKMRTAAAVRESALRIAEADLARMRSLRFALIDGLLLLAVAVVGGALMLRYRITVQRRKNCGNNIAAGTSEPQDKVG